VGSQNQKGDLILGEASRRKNVRAPHSIACGMWEVPRQFIGHLVGKGIRSSLSHKKGQKEVCYRKKTKFGTYKNTYLSPCPSLGAGEIQGGCHGEKENDGNLEQIKYAELRGDEDSLR